MFEHDCLDMCAVLSVLYAFVSYFSICTCPAQLNMFYMERRYRNKIIIVIIFHMRNVRLHLDVINLFL